MGTWSVDTFGNDAACDWVGSFLDSPGLATVASAIEGVNKSDGYLDSYDACECLAACEVIARIQGKWGLRNAYSERLDAWIEAHPTDVPRGLVADADAAIERILGADSELRELWDEGGNNEDWRNAIDDLRVRVRG